MPQQKDLKRLVRARMKKTGESYTTARAHLTRRTSPAKPAPVPPPAVPESGYAAIAGMSDAALKAKTGCTWARWVRALDRIRAFDMPHREIARHLHETFKLEGWWAQTVAVGYERIRGLRERGQRRDGTYEASHSRTFPVPVATLYRAFSTTRARVRWLPGVKLRVRTSSENRSMRITWADGSHVDAWFTDKGAKSQVAVSHRRLASREDATRARKYWGERLDALGELLSR